MSLASRGETGLERGGGGKVGLWRALWPVISRLDIFLHFVYLTVQLDFTHTISCPWTWQAKGLFNGSRKDIGVIPRM